MTKKPEITESRQLEHVEIKGKRRNRLSFASPQQWLLGTIHLISTVMPTALFLSTDRSSYQLCTRAWTCCRLWRGTAAASRSCRSFGSRSYERPLPTRGSGAKRKSEAEVPAFIHVFLFLSLSLWERCSREKKRRRERAHAFLKSCQREQPRGGCSFKECGFVGLVVAVFLCLSFKLIIYCIRYNFSQWSALFRFAFHFKQSFQTW